MAGYVVSKGICYMIDQGGSHLEQAEESKVHSVFKKEDFVRAIGASVCLVLIAICIIIHTLRFIEARRLKKVWYVTLFWLEHSSQHATRSLHCKAIHCKPPLDATEDRKLLAMLSGCQHSLTEI